MHSYWSEKKWCQLTRYADHPILEFLRPYVDTPNLGEILPASTCYNRNFKTLASLCSWADQFESYQVANPEDRFSRDVAHVLLLWFGFWCENVISNLTCAQSYQGLHCLHEETLSPYLPIEHAAETDQTGQMPRAPGWSESLLGTQIICWFCYAAAEAALNFCWFSGCKDASETPGG